MNILVITEKPSVALRVATTLGEGKFNRKLDSGISYYEIENKSDKIFVAAAVGHLFTIVGGGGGFPILEVKWAPAYKLKNKEYTKKYLDAILEIAKKCNFFINACDYDIEGTVIGTNIIKEVDAGYLKNAKRMKFSTTTNEDILEAYKNLHPLDINNFYAGEVRHMLDWLWGINLSIALTRSVYGTSYGKSMLSIGRVQGPSLGLLAKREEEISKFIPRFFWKLTAVIKGTEFENSRGQIFDESIARKALDETENNKNAGVILDIEKTRKSVPPNPAFDLTALQIEASKNLHFDPSRTLSIAQSLYERSFISYPRTSSQKLPASLNLSKILENMSKIKEYEVLAKNLISQKRLKPIEGKKSDEAHPAIYPTGIKPENLSRDEERLYDIIARRFLAAFAEPMEIDRTRVIATFGSEKYYASGNHISRKGWTEFYPFYKPDEQLIQGFEKGENTVAEKTGIAKSQTQPPKRYTKATLLAELEKRNLGTKATRAGIIDTLFKRNYVEGESIMVTKFGASIYSALKKYCEMIVDENTTRKLEKDMDAISKGKETEGNVLKEGKEMLTKALDAFDKNNVKISEELKAGLRSTQTLGKCPKDSGNLVIKKSKTGKFFVGCDNYPKCTNTYPLPGNSKIIPTGKVCEYCHTPIIKVIRFKKVFEMDLDPNCQTKKDWYKKPSAPVTTAGAITVQASKEAEDIVNKETSDLPVPADSLVQEKVLKKEAGIPVKSKLQAGSVKNKTKKQNTRKAKTSTAKAEAGKNKIKKIGKK